MSVNYTKIPKQIERNEKQILPLLCCPVCSSVKASICKECGTFICNNIHNYNVNEVHFYYNKKNVQIEQGHDPRCCKSEIDAKEIAGFMVEHLRKEKVEMK